MLKTDGLTERCWLNDFHLAAEGEQPPPQQLVIDDGGGDADMRAVILGSPDLVFGQGGFAEVFGCRCFEATYELDIS